MYSDTMMNTELVRSKAAHGSASRLSWEGRAVRDEDNVGRRCLLTKEESESRDGSCSLTASRMAFQGPRWEAQGEQSEGPTSLSWEVMGVRAQGKLLSVPSFKEPCRGCR